MDTGGTDRSRKPIPVLCPREILLFQRPPFHRGGGAHKYHVPAPTTQPTNRVIDGTDILQHRHYPWKLASGVLTSIAICIASQAIHIATCEEVPLSLSFKCHSKATITVLRWHQPSADPRPERMSQTRYLIRNTGPRELLVVNTTRRWIVPDKVI